MQSLGMSMNSVVFSQQAHSQYFASSSQMKSQNLLNSPSINKSSEPTAEHCKSDSNESVLEKDLTQKNDVIRTTTVGDSLSLNDNNNFSIKLQDSLWLSPPTTNKAILDQKISNLSDETKKIIDDNTNSKKVTKVTYQDVKVIEIPTFDNLESPVAVSKPTDSVKNVKKRNYDEVLNQNYDINDKNAKRLKEETKASTVSNTALKKVSIEKTEVKQSMKLQKSVDIDLFPNKYPLSEVKSMKHHEQFQEQKHDLMDKFMLEDQTIHVAPLVMSSTSGKTSNSPKSNSLDNNIHSIANNNNSIIEISSHHKIYDSSSDSYSSDLPSSLSMIAPNISIEIAVETSHDPDGWFTSILDNQRKAMLAYKLNKYKENQFSHSGTCDDGQDGRKDASVKELITELSIMSTQPIVIERNLIANRKNLVKSVDLSLNSSANSYNSKSSNFSSANSINTRDFRRFRKNAVRSTAIAISSSDMEKVLPKESERELQVGVLILNSIESIFLNIDISQLNTFM